jgi:hypothetical protein
LQVAEKNAVADMQICIFVEMTPSTWGIMTALVKKNCASPHLKRREEENF